VPHRLAGSEAADGHAVLDHVRDDIDLRIALDEPAPGLLDGRPVELAEAPTEGDQVVVIEVLSAEQQHEVVEPGVMDGGEIGVVDPAQVDAADLGGQGGTGWHDIEVRSRGRTRCGGRDGRGHDAEATRPARIVNSI